MTGPAVVRPSGFHHVRLAVTDIHRSKAFYSWLFGAPPRSDVSHLVDEPGVTPLPAFGVVVLSLQDPDDVDLEFSAPLPGA